jgi:hypothetical protein
VEVLVADGDDLSIRQFVVALAFGGISGVLHLLVEVDGDVRQFHVRSGSEGIPRSVKIFIMQSVKSRPAKSIRKMA